MRIYFATNRNPVMTGSVVTGFGNYLSSKGVTDLRFGSAEFGTDDKYEITVADESLNVDLDKALAGDLTGQKLGSKPIFQEIQKTMREQKKDCVVFLHGYNTSFDDAMKATARLCRLYGNEDKVFLVFTWPSDGSNAPFVAYFNDRQDARASGAAMARGLLKFTDFLRNSPERDRCRQKLHLVAHSMGTYVLRYAVQDLVRGSRSPRQLFDQVLLFAPDEDSDSLEVDYKLKRLVELSVRITVYFNPTDLGLITSRLTKGNSERLGAAGPQNSSHLPNKVTAVNCQKYGAEEEASGHLYLSHSKTVRKDAEQVLDGVDSDEIKGRSYVQETGVYKLV